MAIEWKFPPYNHCGNPLACVTTAEQCLGIERTVSIYISAIVTWVWRADGQRVSGTGDGGQGDRGQGDRGTEGEGALN